jgi:hypothetical protein
VWHNIRRARRLRSSSYSCQAVFARAFPARET